MNEYEYTPDYWKVVKITSTDGTVLHKVFATWVGGYTDGDAWRMNSGIKKVTEDGDNLLFEGHSGSVYKVLNEDRVYRTTMYTYAVLSSMMKRADLIGARIEEVPFETDWSKLT